MLTERIRANGVTRNDFFSKKIFFILVLAVGGNLRPTFYRIFGLPEERVQLRQVQRDRPRGRPRHGGQPQPGGPQEPQNRGYWSVWAEIRRACTKSLPGTFGNMWDIDFGWFFINKLFSKKILSHFWTSRVQLRPGRRDRPGGRPRPGAQPQPGGPQEPQNRGYWSVWAEIRRACTKSLPVTFFDRIQLISADFL